VQVASLDDLHKLATQHTKLERKINNKTLQQAGAVGWLVPLSRTLGEEDLGINTLDFRAAPAVAAKMPIPALRPYRRTPKDPITKVDACISAVASRVIIIGPDVKGSKDRIGEYAETIPETTQHGSRIVKVRFAWQRDEEGRDVQLQAVYHLQCLCLARNVDLPSTQKTNFDAKMPVGNTGWPRVS